VERIRSARAAIDRSGEGVILVGRTEGLLNDPAAINPTIDKLVAVLGPGNIILLPTRTPEMPLRLSGSRRQHF
jgi:hypothetical protein